MVGRYKNMSTLDEIHINEQVKKILSKPYGRTLIPCEEGGFFAEILEFPGCFSQGETVQETYRNINEAAEAWVEACILRDIKIPEPRNKEM